MMLRFAVVATVAALVGTLIRWGTKPLYQPPSLTSEHLDENSIL